jgi:hypothetical protein
MSIVYVLGAGASFGERLTAPDNCPDFVKKSTATPPLIRSFFRRSLFEGINYPGEMAEKDFPRAFEYMRRTRMIKEPVGEGPWNELNIEEVFTSVELDREFQSPESDAGAELILIRNQLIRYIWRIIGYCTDYKQGHYVKTLCDSLQIEDSVITFNWDLLLDSELHPSRIQTSKTHGGIRGAQYHNFFVDGLGVFPMADSPHVVYGAPGKTGMLLKLHGSLDWFQCINTKCPGSSQLSFDRDTEYCLRRAIGIHFEGEECRRCGSETIPLLIPPLLRKPISENSIIRAAWGHARTRLLAANKAVIIGFSAAGTDFYATWLLRSTLGLRANVEIFVVDPANVPTNDNHQEFSQRMQNIFPNGYNSDFRTMSQIDAILKRVVPAD